MRTLPKLRPQIVPTRTPTSPRHIHSRLEHTQWCVHTHSYLCGDACLFTFAQHRCCIRLSISLLLPLHAQYYAAYNYMAPAAAVTTSSPAPNGTGDTASATSSVSSAAPGEEPSPLQAQMAEIQKQQMLLRQQVWHGLV